MKRHLFSYAFSRMVCRRAWYCPDPGYVAIHPGDILAGYRVRRLLGRGGMGEVWAASAEDGVYPRDVAIKVLLASAATKPELVRRFEREARIASAIDNPYVCKLIRVAKADDGTHLLLFELLDGESLADRLRREQYLPFGEVGAIVDDVLQGLVAAHAAGVIHRDLKPANVFLELQRDTCPDNQIPSTERAMILDFGISKLSRTRRARTSNRPSPPSTRHSVRSRTWPRNRSVAPPAPTRGPMSTHWRPWRFMRSRVAFPSKGRRRPSSWR